jgi:EAL domain-containing protein (putative c-di-GMP-specific phosphodiesterase class I)
VRFRPVVELGTGKLSGAVAVPGLASDGAWVAAEDAASGFTERVLDLVGTMPIDVTVRLAGTVLGDPGLADRLAACRAEPRRIVCAVEERALRREASALLALTRLRLKGFGVAVENHATEDLPARLPLTMVRLAGSLLTRPPELEQALERVRSLGLACVATACDSADHLDLLLELGCAHAEGAFIGPAMPAGELADWTPPLAGGTA